MVHGHLDYILMDLMLFKELPKEKPLAKDIQIFREVLSAINELAPTKKAGAYRDLIAKKKLFPTNKQEIAVLVDILGICGVLSTEENPCPCVAYYGAFGLSPQEHVNDFQYRVSYWRASDGINQERLNLVFGQTMETFCGAR